MKNSLNDSKISFAYYFNTLHVSTLWNFREKIKYNQSLISPHWSSKTELILPLLANILHFLNRCNTPENLPMSGILILARMGNISSTL